MQRNRNERIILRFRELAVRAFSHKAPQHPRELPPPLILEAVNALLEGAVVHPRRAADPIRPPREPALSARDIKRNQSSALDRDAALRAERLSNLRHFTPAPVAETYAMTRIEWATAHHTMRGENDAEDTTP